MFFEFLKNLLFDNKKTEKILFKDMSFVNSVHKDNIEIITYKNKSKELKIFLDRKNNNRATVEYDNNIIFEEKDLIFLLQKHL